jgi:protein regulator of cytokinesis 1
LHEILELWTELGISPSSNGASTSTSTSGATTSQTASELAFDLSILHTTQSLSGASSSSSPPSTSSSASSHAHNILKPDKTTLDQLSSRKESLENERETRMQHIQDLYDQLYPLWTKLGVSDEEADEFVEIWKGCEKRCIDAVGLLVFPSLDSSFRFIICPVELTYISYLFFFVSSQYNAELARMLEVKAENMAIFIHREREEIISLWDGLFYSDEQRAHFSLIDSGMF